MRRRRRNAQITHSEIFVYARDMLASLDTARSSVTTEKTQKKKNKSSTIPSVISSSRSFEFHVLRSHHFSLARSHARTLFFLVPPSRFHFLAYARCELGFMCGRTSCGVVWCGVWSGTFLSIRVVVSHALFMKMVRYLLPFIDSVRVVGVSQLLVVDGGGGGIIVVVVIAVVVISVR